MKDTSRENLTDPSTHEENSIFQPDPEIINWRIHFRSPVHKVYNALANSNGRSRFWAESADETDGVIYFKVPGNLETAGRILEQIPNKKFVTEYFGWTVSFHLEPAPNGTGTDLHMSCINFPKSDRTEIIAGWVSVLMAMKAAVDFNVDLRNHDPKRTWWEGYADN